jgi:hypothetical protein
LLNEADEKGTGSLQKAQCVAFTQDFEVVYGSPAPNSLLGKVVAEKGLELLRAWEELAQKRRFPTGIRFQVEIRDGRAESASDNNTGGSPKVTQDSIASFAKMRTAGPRSASMSRKLEHIRATRMKKLKSFPAGDLVHRGS